MKAQRPEMKGECWVNPGKQIEALTLQSDLIKDLRSLKKDIRRNPRQKFGQSLRKKDGS